MSEGHPFDKMMREKLESYSSPVPDGLWDQIAPAVAVRGRRRLPFLWVLATAAFLIVASAAIWMGAGGTSVSGVDEQTVSQRGDDLLSADEQEAFTIEAEPEHAIEIAEAGHEIAIAEAGPVSGTFEAETGASDLNAASEVSEAGSGSVPEISFIPALEGSETDPVQSALPAAIQPTAIPADGKNSDDAGDAARPGIRMNAAIAALPLFERDEGSLADEYRPCAVKTNIQCYSFSPAIRKIYADLLFGPLYHHNMLDAKTEESVAYREIRKETEAYLFSFQASVRAGMVFQNGLSVRAGISYTQLGEKFDYTDPNAERETIINVVPIDTIIDGPNTIIVWDTISVLERGRRTIRHPVKYRFLDIPITVGFELEAGKFTAGFHGGVLFNLLFEQKGRILSPDMQVVYLEKERSNNFKAYKRNAGISLVANLSLGYQWKDDIELVVEPNVRYILDPVSLDGYPLDQRFNILGVQMGLRKRF